MEKIMAVVAKEQKYAERFCEYVNRKKLLLLPAVPFCDAKACSAYSETHPIELLLMDREMEQGVYRTAKNSHSEIRAKRKLYFGKNQTGVRESSKQGGHSYGGSDLNKYQSAEALLEEIIGLTGDMELLRARSAGGKALRVIGIYSPISRCGKTSFAVTLCRDMARRKKILYLNLDEFPTAAGLMQTTPSEGISEAVYQLKQGKLDSAKISALTDRVFNFDWIPPVSIPDDAGVISGEDYLELINTVIRGTDYDCIVIDMNRYGGQADVLMDLCDVVYIPGCEDFLSGQKTSGFLEMLTGTRGEAWCERLRQIVLPQAETSGYQPSYADALLYGPMGDFVRELKEA